MQTHLLGARPDPPDRRDYRYSARRAAAQVASGERKLPPSINNSDECTRVWRQQDSDCVGQALVGIAEFLYWRKLAIVPEFSPWATYCWAKFCDLWAGEDYEGTSLRAGLKAWAKFGMCPLELWPYMDVPQSNPLPIAAQYPLRRYEALRGLWETKHAIHQHGAVVATMCVHSGWDEPVGGVIQPGSGSGDEFHAVMFCGYDDRYGLMVRNSWGKYWGRGGYAFLRYADFHQNATNVWLPHIENGGWWARFIGRIFRRV